jgi:hypothetical protein
LNHSEACSQGELGDFHFSVGFGRIPREKFEEMKASGFQV